MILSPATARHLLSGRVSTPMRWFVSADRKGYSRACVGQDLSMGRHRLNCYDVAVRRSRASVFNFGQYFLEHLRLWYLAWQKYRTSRVIRLFISRQEQSSRGALRMGGMYLRGAFPLTECQDQYDSSLFCFTISNIHTICIGARIIPAGTFRDLIKHIIISSCEVSGDRRAYGRISRREDMTHNWAGTHACRPGFRHDASPAFGAERKESGKAGVRNRPHKNSKH